MHSRSNLPPEPFWVDEPDSADVLQLNPKSLPVVAKFYVWLVNIVFKARLNSIGTET